MKTFFRVQNISNEKDFHDEETIEKARAYILEKDLHEDTHRLLKFVPKKSDNVELGIFKKGNEPLAIYASHEKDPRHITMIAAISGYKGGSV